jgi:hypothetical protein
MLRRTCLLFCTVLGLSALALFTTACSSSSNKTEIRLVNAMPDQGSLDLLIDTKSAVTSVGYGAGSSYVSVASGSRHLQVEPTGGTTILIDRTDNIGSGSSLTLVSLNIASNPSSVLLTDDNSAPTSGNFKLRIVNASPGMLTQDVYVVTDGTDISGVNATISGLGFGSSSDYNTLAAGDYDVIFTDPGTKFQNLNSGKLTFAAGAVRTLLGLNNPNAGGFEATVLTDSN